MAYQHNILLDANVILSPIIFEHYIVYIDYRQQLYRFQGIVFLEKVEVKKYAIKRLRWLFHLEAMR
jgi:hypothetical protein